MEPVAGFQKPLTQRKTLTAVPSDTALPSGPLDALPLHRFILAVDIEGSTNRTNPVKAHLRQEVYRFLEEALLAADIGGPRCDPFIDRGDGVLALIHPVERVSRTLLLNPVIPTLARLLNRHNIALPEAQRERSLRLRAVVHAGEVHYDARGCFGEALDIAFRLLDAPGVKKGLRQARAPLVLVISREIYSSVVRHHYDGIDARTFEPSIRVEIAGQRHHGWIQVPDVPELAPQHSANPL